jgi:hypothetical protein
MAPERAQDAEPFVGGSDAAPLPFDAGRHPETEAEIAQLRRRSGLLYIAAPAASLAMLLLGFHLSLPLLAAAGVIGLGATAFALGALAIAERRLFFLVRSLKGERWRYVIYEGFAAVPFGLSLIALGASLAALAALSITGHSIASLRDQMLARPGYALVPLGILLAAQGLGFLIGFSRRARSLRERVWISLMNLPGRLGGLILFAWGAAALVAGLVEWVAPELFRHWFQSLAGNPWPFDGH